MINILSVDLEDYYQVSAFDSVVKRQDWDKYESRIERNTHRLLDILNGSMRHSQSAIRNPVRATFFCLGWIAERYPGLIKRIKKEKHEIACHGYAHKLVYKQKKEEFREDIRKAKAILEDITGDEAIGYRAPSYSITGQSLWAFEILREEGFRYDSSIFPIHHDRYGIADAPRFPFIISMNGNNTFEFIILNMDTEATKNYSPVPLINQGNSLSHFSVNSTNSINATKPSAIAGLAPSSLLEFPLSTVRLLGQNIPISGGGYFRLFPYSIIRKGLKHLNQRGKMPFVFYLHPWELDPDQPRMNGISRRSRFRHYLNLEKTETRIKNLLGDFNFFSFKEAIEPNKSNE